MKEKLKIGLSLVVIGILILTTSFLLNQKLENKDEVSSKNIGFQLEFMLASNFCGGVLLLAGIVVILINILKDL